MSYAELHEHLKTARRVWFASNRHADLLRVKALTDKIKEIDKSVAVRYRPYGNYPA